ncbi:MAG: ATP-binding protein [Verrucomicrobia bacterium]|nr:ATP-binding protein [Verrucomicrobiota bacterium]
MKSAFVEKLLGRLDRLDPESLQTQFMRIVQERGLLETIFQSIQEGIIVVDRESRLKYANRAAETLVGVAFEKFEGKPIARAMRDIDWDQILDTTGGAWTRLVSRELEVTYPQHRFVSIYAVPLTGEGKDGGGAVIILRDVSHERQQEADLVESERLNAVKLLAAGVAHEIGNPLNALNIHLQLLHREIRGLPDEKQAALRELVEVARAETQRLDLIITQFLRAIRPAPPDLAPASIEQLLKETLVVMRPEILNRKIEVHLEQADGLPQVPVDRDQIKQVCFNVIKNAIQAMSDGGRLGIALSVSDRHLIMAFQDTGTGIRPEDFGRVFEPYHTTKPDGSGLGLMIVQRIVQDHGGQIELQSKPGEGTRFTVLLPLAERRVRMLNASGPRAGTVGEASDGAESS